MLASLLIVFREVLEAGLIVGIVLAATEGVTGRGRYVAGGIVAGIAGAALLAVFAGAVTKALAGYGLEIFTAGILIVAVAMLGWHNIWMASHGRQIASQMKALGRSVAMGERSLTALAVVIAVAVLREGSEVVLFLYGIAVSTQSDAASLLGGGALGIAGGAALSWLLYRGLLVIPLRHLFSVTSWLIALLAAGMAGRAAAILAGADLIPAWGWQMWDTSWLVPDGSILGKALQALVGYSDRPMGVQLVVWAATLGVLVTLPRMLQAAPARAPALSGR